MENFRYDNVSFKYQRFTQLGYKDIGMGKFKSVAKTPFLCNSFWTEICIISFSLAKEKIKFGLHQTHNLFRITPFVGV